MGKFERQYQDNKLTILSRSGATLQVFNTATTKKFAVILKCGHCGRNRFIPIVFPVSANDKKEAVAITRTYPRVKRNGDRFILMVKEISELEYKFLFNCNLYDPYLNPQLNLKTPLKDIIKARRVDDLGDTPLQIRKNLNKIKYPIRTSADFPSNMTLQQAFSPRCEGGQYVYSNNINDSQVLKNYYKEQTLFYSFYLGKAQFACFYYQMFGKENDLGIIYKDEKLLIPIKNKLVELSLSEQQSEYLNKDEEAQKDLKDLKEKQSSENEESFLTSAPSPRISPVEKFNKKYSRFLNLDK